MANEYVSKIVLSSGDTLIDLTSDTITPADLAKNVTAHDKSGAPITGTSTKDVDSTDATAAASEILEPKTAYARGVKIVGTMPNRGSVNGVISSKTPYTIQQGYHDGSGKVAIDSTSAAALVPENIREGIEILGITGQMSGSEDMSAQAVTVTPTFTQQTITPDSTQGYNCISQVTVAPISVVYSDNSAGGQTVTIG